MIMSITVANSMDMNKAKDIKDKLNSLMQGKTFMDFNFISCPIGGSFDIMLEGNADSEEELREMYTHVVTSELLFVTNS